MHKKTLKIIMSYDKNMFCKLALCNAMLRQVSLFKYTLSDVKKERLEMFLNVGRAFNAIGKRVP